MPIPSTGTVNFSQIVNEYTGNGNQRTKMSLLYSVGATNMYTVPAGMHGVGKISSPNVPASGLLSVSNFKGASQKSGTAVSYPPSAMTSYTTVIGGNTYAAAASSERGAALSPWMAFDNTVSADTYSGWQTNDGAYNGTTGAALTNQAFDGFTPGDYTGEWISFALPFPIYLQNYTIQGDAVDWRIYASLTPNVTSSWTVVHTGARTSPTFSQTNTYTLNLTVPYIKYVMKITKSNMAAGFGRGAMNYIVYNGYPA